MSVLDPAAAARLRRLGGEKLLREMIALFVQHGPERLERAAGSDVAEAERACHSLKSAAANLGAHGLQEAAAAAELTAVRGDAAAHAAALVALRANYDRAAAALQQLLRESA